MGKSQGKLEELEDQINTQRGKIDELNSLKLEKVKEITSILSRSKKEIEALLSANEFSQKTESILANIDNLQRKDKEIVSNISNLNHAIASVQSNYDSFKKSVTENVQGYFSTKTYTEIDRYVGTKYELRNQVSFKRFGQVSVYKLGDFAIEVGNVQMPRNSNGVSIIFKRSFSDLPNVLVAPLSDTKNDYGYAIARNVTKTGFSCAKRSHS